MHIFTSSWSTRLPDTIVRVGISRGTPRGLPGGYRLLRDLQPGPWFRSVEPAEYLVRYDAILAGLDPRAIVARLEEFGGGRDVAMLCFESPASIASGETWCHRSVAAQWLNDTTGAGVTEFGRPDLDPWSKLRRLGVALPHYARPQTG